jgi:N utilization substance protein A
MAKVKEEQNAFSDFTGAMTALAEEKGISVDDVMATVETAIAAAYKKEYGKRGQNIRAELNSVSGDMKFYLMKEVVDDTSREFIDPDAEEEEVSEEVVQDIIMDEEDQEERKPRFNPERDIVIDDAKKQYGDVAVGDVVEEELPSYTEFGRVAAQTAKQVIIQRIRESERNAMYAEYKEKEGEVINGTVQRVEGKNVFVDLGKSVGVLFPREQVRGEKYNVGQRVKVYVESVELDPKGPGIKLSRVHPELIRRLFELEVPEIFAGSVEIKAIAREAGSRSKIAVYTEEEGIDPIGSCVGQKGTRVNAIIDELGGEKVDIIEWSENTEEFITAALSPATVLNVILDEEAHKATVVVPNDQLSLAIGKRGQNVRLAVKLTHWDLDVISADESRVPGATEDASEDAVAPEESAEVGSAQEESSEPAEAVEDPSAEDTATTEEAVEETLEEETSEEEKEKKKK